MCAGVMWRGCSCRGRRWLRAADSACGSKRRDEVIGRVEAREGIPGGNEGVQRYGVAREGGITAKEAETPAKTSVTPPVVAMRPFPAP